MGRQRQAKNASVEAEQHGREFMAKSLEGVQELDVPSRLRYASGGTGQSSTIPIARYSSTSRTVALLSAVMQATQARRPRRFAPRLPDASDRRCWSRSSTRHSSRGKSVYGLAPRM